MTISIKQCIVYGRFTYNQVQTMDRNRLGFKTAMLWRNFRKVSILGQMRNCFPTSTKGKTSGVTRDLCLGRNASESPLFDGTSWENWTPLRFWQFISSILAKDQSRSRVLRTFMNNAGFSNSAWRINAAFGISNKVLKTKTLKMNKEPKVEISVIVFVVMKK